MKNDLVKVIKKDVFISSVKLSEMLGVKHAFFLKTLIPILKRLEKQVVEEQLVFKYPQKFIETTFTNKMGRTYKMYDMNEQAYMKMAMHLKGYEKAEQVQDAIIEAFSMMKEALLNQTNQSWLSERNKTKQLRLVETDTIKEFVEYATKQGSKNANFYYANITKMTNKALELLVQSKHGSPIRDLLEITEMGFLMNLELRATKSLEYGMEQKLPYKFIYKYAKEEVNKLANALNFKKIAIN